jgi:hypothetical protein
MEEDKSSKIMTVGKHAGATFGELIKRTRYIEYIRENGKRPEYKELVRYYDTQYVSPLILNA